MGYVEEVFCLLKKEDAQACSGGSPCDVAGLGLNIRGSSREEGSISLLKRLSFLGEDK